MPLNKDVIQKMSIYRYKLLKRLKTAVFCVLEGVYM